MGLHRSLGAQRASWVLIGPAPVPQFAIMPAGFIEPMLPTLVDFRQRLADAEGRHD